MRWPGQEAFLYSPSDLAAIRRHYASKFGSSVTEPTAPLPKLKKNEIRFDFVEKVEKSPCAVKCHH